MRILCGTILAAAVVAIGAGAGYAEKVAADFALVKDGEAVAAFEFGANPSYSMMTFLDSMTISAPYVPIKSRS